MRSMRPGSRPSPCGRTSSDSSNSICMPRADTEERLFLCSLQHRLRQTGVGQSHHRIRKRADTGQDNARRVLDHVRRSRDFIFITQVIEACCVRSSDCLRHNLRLQYNSSLIAFRGIEGWKIENCGIAQCAIIELPLLCADSIHSPFSIFHFSITANR